MTTPDAHDAVANQVELAAQLRWLTHLHQIDAPAEQRAAALPPIQVRADEASRALTAREREHAVAANEAMRIYRHELARGATASYARAHAVASGAQMGAALHHPDDPHRRREDAVLAEAMHEAHIDAAPTEEIRGLVVHIAAAQQALRKLRDTHASTCEDVIGLYHEGQDAYGYEPDEAAATALSEADTGVPAVYENAYYDLDEWADIRANQRAERDSRDPSERRDHEWAQAEADVSQAALRDQVQRHRGRLQAGEGRPTARADENSVDYGITADALPPEHRSTERQVDSAGSALQDRKAWVERRTVGTTRRTSQVHAVCECGLESPGFDQIDRARGVAQAHARHTGHTVVDHDTALDAAPRNVPPELVALERAARDAVAAREAAHRMTAERVVERTAALQATEGVDESSAAERAVAENVEAAGRTRLHARSLAWQAQRRGLLAIDEQRERDVLAVPATNDDIDSTATSGHRYTLIEVAACQQALQALCDRPYPDTARAAAQLYVAHQQRYGDTHEQAGHYVTAITAADAAGEYHTARRQLSVEAEERRRAHVATERHHDAASDAQPATDLRGRPADAAATPDVAARQAAHSIDAARKAVDALTAYRVEQRQRRTAEDARAEQVIRDHATDTASSALASERLGGRAIVGWADGR